MPDFYEMCVALLAAIGAVCLIWAVVGIILRPRRDFPLTALVQVRGAGELMEAIHSCGWARRWGSGGFDVLIISDSLEPEALQMASLYAGCWDGVVVCSLEEAVGDGLRVLGDGLRVTGY